MAIQIKTTGLENYLDPTDEQAYIKMLLAGEPGTGKTRTASFWPRPIYADCENGLKSVADRQVPFAAIRSTKDMRDFIDFLKRECMKRGASRQYQTAVLDTLDKLQSFAKAEILGEVPGKTSLSGWKDWQRLGDKMVPLYTDLMALPMNVIVNVHVQETSGDDDDTAAEDENERYYKLRLQGELKNLVTADTDLVGHLQTVFVREGKKRRMERRIRWNNDPTFPVLKDRSGAFPDFTVVNFTEQDYLGLVELMMGDRADALQPQTVVEVIPDAEPEPTRAVPPTPGGPVAAKKAAAPARKTAQPDPAPAERARPAAKKAPAKKAAAAPAEPEDPNGMLEAFGLDGAAVDPATDEGQPAFMGTEEKPGDVALEGIAGALGAEVIEDTEVIEPEPDAPPVQAARVVATKPVPGPAALICGSPFRADDKPVPGCGKPIVIGQDGMTQRQLQVGQLKTRTNLHGACYDNHRASNR